MFGGEVDKTRSGVKKRKPTRRLSLPPKKLCSAGDTCGAGVPGTGPSHFYEENPPIGGGGSLRSSTGEEGNNSIAVGPDGTVYVGDYGRIQEFNPDRRLRRRIRPPRRRRKPQFVSSLALDSAGDIYERSATQYRNGSPTTQVPGVREYSPDRRTRSFTPSTGPKSGTEPTHIALDPQGDLFASDSQRHPPHVLRSESWRSPLPRLQTDRGTVCHLHLDQVKIRRTAAASPRGIAFGDGQAVRVELDPEATHIAVHPTPGCWPARSQGRGSEDVQPRLRFSTGSSIRDGYDTDTASNT